jgi:DNA polymerase elongation subunit (family B)
MKTIVIDTEVFKNLFLLCGLILETGDRFHIWGHEEDACDRLKELMKSNNTFITFNGNRYDMPVISYFMTGKTTEETKALGDKIIQENLMPWEAEKSFGFKISMMDHIDLIEVAPSFVSLKTYGARMNMPVIQDLPFHHDSIIEEDDFDVVLKYCHNDLDTTAELYNRLQGQLQLRVEISKEYGFDARSKSDSQVAEQMFMKKLKLKRKEPVIPKAVSYKAPEFIQFKTAELQDLLKRMESHSFDVAESGHVILPDFLKDGLVNIGKGIYQMGVGGLHSQHDRKVCYVTDDENCVVDYDVASYYPAIMLNCNLIPMNTGVKFLEEYRKVFHRRLEGKRAGNMVIADSLRIALNGTFGKTANKYSPLYSPDVMINITLTGQLTLLNLIETLEYHKINVISANTDGIMLYYRKFGHPVVEKIIKDFSQRTGFIFEATPYRCVALKDVNNYYAVKEDRSVKIKGIYSAPTLSKNPTAPVVSKAVANWLSRGTPFEETLKNASLTDFISVRSVTGGGVQSGEYLGRVVRWYQTTEQLPPIVYSTNGNKVAKTDGARACMILPKNIPEDLNFDWYFQAIIKTVKDIGANNFL